MDSYADRCPSRETTAVLFGATEDGAAGTPAVETGDGEEAFAIAHGETEEQIRDGENATGATLTQPEETPNHTAEKTDDDRDETMSIATTASMLESILPPGSASSLSRVSSSLSLASADLCEVQTKSTGASDLVDPLCTKCGWPTSPLNAIMKTKASDSAHAKYCCRPCNAIMTMVSR